MLNITFAHCLLKTSIFMHFLKPRAQSIYKSWWPWPSIGPAVLSPFPCQSETIPPLIDQPTTRQDKGCEEEEEEEEEEGIGSRGSRGGEDAKTHFAEGGTGHSTKLNDRTKLPPSFHPRSYTRSLGKTLANSLQYLITILLSNTLHPLLPT